MCRAVPVSFGITLDRCRRITARILQDYFRFRLHHPYRHAHAHIIHTRIVRDRFAGTVCFDNNMKLTWHSCLHFVGIGIFFAIFLE